MRTVERAGTAIVFALFFAAIVLRPLRSNPGVAAAVEEGFGWPTVLWLPLVAISLLLVVVRFSGLVDAESDDRREQSSGLEASGSTRDDDRRIETGWLDEDDSESEADNAAEGGVAFVPETVEALSKASAEAQRPVRQRPVYGVGRREVDVEQRPPDAPLHAHLEHLRAELDGDDQVGEDLHELERVVAETADDNPIPDRCPQDHCEARWAERSVLGINTGRYEVLEDGQVCCLECESVVSVDGVE
jgi:hypothetical protein